MKAPVKERSPKAKDRVGDSTSHSLESGSEDSYYRYFSFGLRGAIDRVLFRVRREIYGVFMREFSPGATDRILDVGVSRNDHPSANILEKQYPHTCNITAVGKDDTAGPEPVTGGLVSVRADGKALPFRDRSFDYVYSHAVIEHVGSSAEQARFLGELLRVCRKGVFVTTPNRWHPVELHVGLPFFHYMPPALHRRVYRLLGKGFYGTEENLNLLSRRSLLKLWRKTGGKPGVRADVISVRWLGISSNLILVVRRKAV